MSVRPDTAPSHFSKQSSSASFNLGFSSKKKRMLFVLKRPNLAVVAVVFDVLGAAVGWHLLGQEEHVVPHARQYPVPPVDAGHL